MSSNQNVTEQYVSSIDEQPVIMDFTDDLVPFATAQPQVSCIATQACIKNNAHKLPGVICST
jgi:hypothetical protein